MALCSIALAVGIIGAAAVVKRFVFRRRFGMAGCGRGFGGHDFAGRGGFGFGPYSGPGRSFWLRALFSRLDTTPGQEREIRAALEDFQGAARSIKEGAGEVREHVARAVSGEIFDEDAASAASAHVDASLGRMKDAFTTALRRIHAVLDPKQRERLSELLAKGWRFGRGLRGWGGGPYRSASL